MLDGRPHSDVTSLSVSDPGVACRRLQGFVYIYCISKRWLFKLGRLAFDIFSLYTILHGC
jgi:hypothetical protein